MKVKLHYDYNCRYAIKGSTDVYISVQSTIRDLLEAVKNTLLNSLYKLILQNMFTREFPKEVKILIYNLPLEA